jgi:hypothetical protein
MTSPGKLTSRFRVGRFTCVLAANITGDLGLTCEWEPKIPKRLSPDAIAAYRAGRDAFFAQLGEALGQTVAIVEADPNGARVTVPRAEECRGRS